ncbi:hypothetical protein RIF29_20588 [Crotalaria pallida]|uniref:Uncharacterized protein n=1 Tax=Crotalaria pallida TaxID=3830 RepID=A0AAN9I6H1_CROPI
MRRSKNQWRRNTCWWARGDEPDPFLVPFRTEIPKALEQGRLGGSLEFKAVVSEESSKQVTRRKNRKSTGIVIGASSPVSGCKRKEDAGAAGLISLKATESDHVPIIILMNAEIADDSFIHKSRMFRFEEAWVYEPNAEGVTKAAWRETQGDGITKISAMKTKLKCLSKNTVTSLRREILKVEQALSGNDCWEADATSLNRFTELKEKHASLLQEEEMMWRQRSRALWLQHGDKNSKFFHRKASQRREINSIKKSKGRTVI